MFSKTHQGIVKKTVVLEFENGYLITLEAGVEMSMHLVMDEAQIKAAEHRVQPTIESGRALPAKKSNRKGSAPAKSG